MERVAADLHGWDPNAIAATLIQIKSRRPEAGVSSPTLTLTHDTFPPPLRDADATGEVYTTQEKTTNDELNFVGGHMDADDLDNNAARGVVLGLVAAILSILLALWWWLS